MNLIGFETKSEKNLHDYKRALGDIVCFYFYFFSWKKEK